MLWMKVNNNNKRFMSFIPTDMISSHSDRYYHNWLRSHALRAGWPPRLDIRESMDSIFKDVNHWYRATHRNIKATESSISIHFSTLVRREQRVSNFTVMDEIDRTWILSRIAIKINLEDRKWLNALFEGAAPVNNKIFTEVIHSNTVLDQKEKSQTAPHQGLMCIADKLAKESDSYYWN